MILFIHILIVAAIVVLIKPLSLALIFVFFSHYLLDALPHCEYRIEFIKNKTWNRSLKDFSKIFLDIAIGYIILFSLSKDSPKILIAAFIAIIPDGIAFLHIVFGGKIIYLLQKLHQKTHFPKRAFSVWKIILPLTAVILSLAVLFPK